jgi:hypothetical protein
MEDDALAQGPRADNDLRDLEELHDGLRDHGTGDELLRSALAHPWYAGTLLCGHRGEGLHGRPERRKGEGAANVEAIARGRGTGDAGELLEGFR